MIGIPIARVSSSLLCAAGWCEERKGTYGKDIARKGIQVDERVDAGVVELLHASRVVGGRVHVVHADRVGSERLHQSRVQGALRGIDERVVYYPRVSFAKAPGSKSLRQEAASMDDEPGVN